MKRNEYVDMLEDYYLTFSTEAGQRVLQRLRTEILENMSYDPSDSDTNKMCWREGQRFVIMTILDYMKFYNDPKHIEELFEDEEEEGSTYL